MSIFKALLLAATAYLRVLPMLHIRKLYKDYENYEDEILDLASSGSAADELRMEQMVKRRDRIDKQIRIILAKGDLEEG